MMPTAMKLFLAITLCAPAHGMCGGTADYANTLRETHHGDLALSVITHARRVEPPADFRFNYGRAVQFTERGRFEQAEREKMRAFHKAFIQLWQDPLPAAVSCPQAQHYVERVLDRLIEGSSLRQAIQRADFPVRPVVTCGIADFPDAEIKAGVLELSAELILALSSEDELAAMMGHELAHYTLAHDARKLQVHAGLTPYTARALSIKHEIEADNEGLILLANAGYDPYAAVDALKKMREILLARRLRSDDAHPDIEDRIRNVLRQIAIAQLQPVPRRTHGLPTIQDEIRARPAQLLKNLRTTLATD